MNPSGAVNRLFPQACVNRGSFPRPKHTPLPASNPSKAHPPTSSKEQVVGATKPVDNSLKTKDLLHTAAERGKRTDNKINPKTRIKTPDSLRQGQVKPLARLLRCAQKSDCAREECPGSRRSCHRQPTLSSNFLYPSATSKNRFTEPLNRPALTGSQLSPIPFASSISSTYGLV